MGRDETWLKKLKSQISIKLPTSKNSPRVGVLAFEIASLLSKLLTLHHSLSSAGLLSVLPGVRKLVSEDETVLLSVAASEITDTLRHLSTAVTRFSSRCCDHNLQRFDTSLCLLFADTGVDLHGWSTPAGKELDGLIRRAERLISSTSALYREMEELALLENSKHLDNNKTVDNNISVERVVWQKQEVKYLREKSLWNRTFDSVVLLCAKLIFTLLARVANHRELSLASTTPPPEDTVGGAGLALHYSNLIIITEKMIKSPHLVGLDAREDLYSMLPSSIRSALRSRLKGVGFSATDPSLAAEWRDALSRILHWLAPLGYNMIQWQTERSFEHRNSMSKSNTVFLLQTLFFANREKTEAAIAELLVGLNYIWRFEREMNAKALFQCSKFFSNNNKCLQT